MKTYSLLLLLAYPKTTFVERVHLTSFYNIDKKKVANKESKFVRIRGSKNSGSVVDFFYIKTKSDICDFWWFI